LAYALRPAEGLGRHLKEAVLAFVAFYFLLLGLRFMAGSISDSLVLLGDLFASLALTFFWLTRRK
jgi:divalent metal cation (Fe/Co/Zn/Cd) transporter